ncbi:unnamed protein product, partial [Mesorhabditis belari]|uniref:ATP-dependent RNA helicase n=1 Tax=Mesorhabditis belari TaxID=2138241 RepID=A0AAF3EU80_9BILA
MDDSSGSLQPTMENEYTNDATPQECTPTVIPAEMMLQRLESFEDCTQIAQAFISYLRKKDEMDPHRPIRESYKPTIVQQYVYPFLANREHVMVRAPTGSGKTIAFLLPIIESLLRQGPNADGNPRCIVLADTRDLVEQHWKVTNSIVEELDAIGQHLTTECFIGGFGGSDRNSVPYGKFIGGRVKCDIAFFTAGRLAELLGGYRRIDGSLSPKKLSLCDLQYLVIDEADEIFFPQKFSMEIDKLGDSLKECYQSFVSVGKEYNPSLSLYSATLVQSDIQIQRAIEKLTNGATMDNFGFVALDIVRPNIVQQILKFDGFIQKFNALVQLLDRDLKANGTTRANCRTHEHYDYSTIIFCDTKSTVYCLTSMLVMMGFYVKFHNGSLSMPHRRENDVLLNQRKLPFLVTTNALARGIDKPYIKHIIMFDLPVTNWDAYTHRVGRTGRSDSIGYATIFFTTNQVNDQRRGPLLLRTLYLMKQKLPRFLLNNYGPSVFSEEFMNDIQQSEQVPNFEGDDTQESESSFISLAQLAGPEESVNADGRDTLDDDDVLSNMTTVLPEEEEMLASEQNDLSEWAEVSRLTETRPALVAPAKAFTNPATSAFRTMFAKINGSSNAIRDVRKDALHDTATGASTFYESENESLKSDGDLTTYSKRTENWKERLIPKNFKAFIQRDHPQREK